MIKLENPTNAPQASTLLAIQSLNQLPTVSLTVDEKAPRKRVGETWIEDNDHRSQSISFINAHGDPVAIEGLVPTDECVQIAGAFKVVAQVRLFQGLKGAFERGGVSKSYTGLELVRVVEVWSSATKCLWRAANGHEATAPAKTLNEAGRVVGAGS